MPTGNTDRMGHGRLVREQVTTTLLDVLTESFRGNVTDPAVDAHKIVTKPGAMNVWLEEIARMASAADESILDKNNRIVEAIKKKLKEHGATLPRAAQDALTLSMTAILGTPNADLDFETVSENVTRRLVKALEQIMQGDPPPNYEEQLAKFEKYIRRILSRLRHRKTNADESVENLLGCTGYILGQLDCPWEQPALDEFRTLGSEVWELLIPYREREGDTV